MSNFCLRLSKEMIVKNFTIVFKEKNIPVYARQREILPPLIRKRTHFYNSPFYLACIHTISLKRMIP